MSDISGEIQYTDDSYDTNSGQQITPQSSLLNLAMNNENDTLSLTDLANRDEIDPMEMSVNEVDTHYAYTNPNPHPNPDTNDVNGAASINTNDNSGTNPNTSDNVSEKSSATSVLSTSQKSGITHISDERNVSKTFPDKFHWFKYEFFNAKRNNTHVLEESKECKRLLDLKYNDLVNMVNRIQTSVIFTSTISGFIQATKTQFNFGETANSIVSITIATYISLILSISKYYGLDELKERIQLLREKYSLLLNEIDYNMDKLGPWSYRKQWLNANSDQKYIQWKNDEKEISERYEQIIATKKELTSEYEDIMDTKSRNYYQIENKRLNIRNKTNVYKWEHKEQDLEKQIAEDKKKSIQYARQNQLDMQRNSIVLSTEEMDNWSFSDWSDVV